MNEREEQERQETDEILADEKTMAAIRESEAELEREDVNGDGRISALEDGGDFKVEWH